MRAARSSGSRRRSKLRFESGFTLIELLVVIAIIAILAGMLLPTIAHAKTIAKIKMTKVAIAQLETAINAYHAEYSHYPVPPQVDAAVGTNDFTFGTVDSTGKIVENKDNSIAAFSSYSTGINFQVCNKELVAILLSTASFRNGKASKFVPSRNPRKVGTFSAAQAPAAGTDPSTSQGIPGVGVDGVYRDPFGNPYIISLDLNSDGNTTDGIYSLPNVATDRGKSPAGVKGMVKVGNDYVITRPVAIWSFGPDGAADEFFGAATGLNKDNILSWQDR